MGCGATNLRRRFAKYLGDKPVLFGPFKSLERVTKNKELLQAERTKNVQLIRDALSKGKSSLFGLGDPAIYGSWRFLKDYFFMGLKGSRTFNEVLKIAKKEQEKWLGLIYIGPCLQGGRLICP